MICLDKDGWPIELIKGKPITNFIRRLIHTRSIVRQWEPTPQKPDPHVAQGSVEKPSA